MSTERERGWTPGQVAGQLGWTAAQNHLWTWNRLLDRAVAAYWARRVDRVRERRRRAA